MANIQQPMVQRDIQAFIICFPFCTCHLSKSWRFVSCCVGIYGLSSCGMEPVKHLDLPRLLLCSSIDPLKHLDLTESGIGLFPFFAHTSLGGLPWILLSVTQEDRYSSMIREQVLSFLIPCGLLPLTFSLKAQTLSLIKDTKIRCKQDYGNWGLLFFLHC